MSTLKDFSKEEKLSSFWIEIISISIVL